MSEKQPLLAGAPPPSAPPPTTGGPCNSPAGSQGPYPTAGQGGPPYASGPYGGAPAAYQQDQGPSGPYPAQGSMGDSLSSSAAVEMEQPSPEVVMPSAPPTYEQVGTSRNAIQLPPPPYIANADLQTALVDAMTAKCCAGAGAAKSMTITNTDSRSALHYIFESFNEKRSIRRVTVAFQGQDVDGPERGPAPGPWEIPISPPNKFKKGTAVTQVPHTCQLQVCYKCAGAGRHQCHSCHGRGRDRCTFCHGQGHRHTAEGRERCHHCHGMGTRTCHMCHGSGMRRCGSCRGSGQLMTYTELTVEWVVHREDHLFQEDILGCDASFVAQSGSRVLLEEEGVRIAPFSGSSIPKLDTMSNQIVQQHASSWPNEATLAQRHFVSSVPIFRADASWKNKNFAFWVCGMEQKVHAPDYPQASCMGMCSLL